MSLPGYGRLAVADHTAFRLGALASLAVLSGVFLSVLYEAVSVVTSPLRFLLVIGFTLAMAVLFAGVLSHGAATILSFVMLGAGTAVYLVLAPNGFRVISSLTVTIRELFVLLTGTTILTIVAVDIWAMAVAPGPLFLCWYLALRSRYAPAAGVGLVPAVLFMLTGDLSFELGVLASLAAAGTVGFGELARMRARFFQADLLAILLAVMLVSSLAVAVVPTGGADLPSTDTIEERPSETSEEAFVTAGGDVRIGGGPSLDPEVRYTIEAEEARNWRVDAYDRYTGDGWVQTGEGTGFEETPLDATAEEATMTVRTEVDGLTAMPARFEPRRVDGVEGIRQTPEAGLHSREALEEGVEYEVVSSTPNASREELRAADGEVPPGIAERYTQLPTETPDRVGELTANLTADAGSTYEAALLIEQYLLSTKNYSLDVPPPSGDVADVQLFERDEGYCVYFATTMAVMLRTQDIPARMATGYSSGERVDEDRWVVRGMNAHAWVEVYVPEIGWVAFDPTPSDPYDAVREERLESARADDAENVDTDESGEEWTPAEENTSETSSSREDLAVHCEDPEAVASGNLSAVEARAVCSTAQLETMEGVETNVSADGNMSRDRAFAELAQQAADTRAMQESETPEQSVLPAPERLALWLAVLIGGAATLRRTRLTGYLRDVFAVRWQGRPGDPQAATERAWRRLERHLARRYRPRADGESVRRYVERLDVQHGLDPDVRAVLETYERARYRPGGVDATEARAAVERVDTLVGRWFEWV